MAENNGKKENIEMVATKPLEGEVIETKPALKPSNISDTQSDKIRRDARELIKELIKAEGSIALTVKDKIQAIGASDKKLVNTNLSIVQEKLGNVYYGENKNPITEGITKDIANLQQKLVKINPAELQKENMYRMMRYIPFVGKWLSGWMRDVNNKRLTIGDFIDHVAESLSLGETKLKQDNAQLKIMYEDVEDNQKIVMVNAYMAEIAAEELEKAIADVGDEKKRNDLNEVLRKLLVKAQDLRAVEQMHEQFFVSIGITHQSNDHLVEAVERVRTLCIPLAKIAGAIAVALTNQKKVLGIARGTQEFVGNQMISNAQMIHQQVKEIGDIYKNPIVAVDKLEKAKSELMSAIDAVNAIKTESIEIAHQNIIKIKVMTEDIRKKSEELTVSDIKSLEGSSYIQIPEKLE